MIKGRRMKPTTVIVGRVGKNEKKEIGENTVSNVSIAVDEYFRSENEESKSRIITHWYNIEAWNSKSKIFENHIKIGQLVAVKVKIENNLHSKNQDKKHEIKFIVETVNFQFENNITDFNCTDIPF